MVVCNICLQENMEDVDLRPLILMMSFQLKKLT